ncbi:hypothetical protein [Latilactobacillus curvatus]|uniref:hypothetical protein n=1 Tax=Latilactobacillus curvatus TaxID=28038 RepID=UPI0007EACD81|nr:hypothetical protein [Latilactobacillus curvatus]ANJ69831.1 hypothetical protein FBA2_07535 [Latilactobacillus curvatus]
MSNRVIIIFKKFSYTISSNLMSLIISTLFILIVPKLIGVEEYGYWQIYLFYSTYVGILQFGWDDGIYLRYGGKKYHELNKPLLFSQFYSLMFFQAVLMAFIFIISFFNNDSNKVYIIQMSGICMFIFNLRGMLLYLLQDTNRIKEYAIVTIFDRFIYALLIALFLIIDVRDYRILILGDLIGKLCSLILSMYLCKEVVIRKVKDFSPSFKEIMLNIDVGVKLLVANFASMLIIGVVRYSIEKFWGIRIFGQVSLTLSISNLLMTFITAISLVLFPILRRTNYKRLREVYLSVRNILMTILFLGLFLYFPMEAILPLWLTKYKGALKYISILFPMIIYEGKFELLINTFMKTLRMEKWLLRVNIISLAFSGLMVLFNLFYVKKLTVMMFSIIIILAFRSTLSELIILKKFKLNLIHELLAETTMVISFILFSWFLDIKLSFLLYIIIFIIYVLIHGKSLRLSFSSLGIIHEKS